MTERSEGNEFWQDADAYHGEIARAGQYRVALSPSGKRYLLQQRGETAWTVRRWRKLLSLLLPDVPPELAAQLPELPEDPQHLPRPWAEATRELGERMAKASVKSDKFAGEIWRGDAVRLVRTERRKADVYAVQLKIGNGWRTVTSATTAANLFDAVNTRYPEGHRLKPVQKHRGLLAAIVRLPAAARDAPGKRPERLADVRVSRSAGVTAKKQRRPLSGPLTRSQR